MSKRSLYAIQTGAEFATLLFSIVDGPQELSAALAFGDIAQAERYATNIQEDVTIELIELQVIESERWMATLKQCVLMTPENKLVAVVATSTVPSVIMHDGKIYKAAVNLALRNAATIEFFEVLDGEIVDTSKLPENTTLQRLLETKQVKPVKVET
jgi:hypothetical protein